MAREKINLAIFWDKFAKDIQRIEREHLQALQERAFKVSGSSRTGVKFDVQSRVEGILDKLELNKQLKRSEWRFIGANLSIFKVNRLQEALKSLEVCEEDVLQVAQGLLKYWLGGPPLEKHLALLDSIGWRCPIEGLAWYDFAAASSLIRKVPSFRDRIDLGQGMKGLVWLFDFQREKVLAVALNRFLDPGELVIPDFRPWAASSNMRSLDVAVLAVKTALELWWKSPSSPEAVRLFEEIVGHRYIGDPRGFEKSSIWNQIEDQYPELFRRVLGQLNREDIDFFFRKLRDLDEDRRNFWIEYAPLMRRSVVILIREEREALLAQFGDGAPELAIVKRGKVWRTGASKNFLVFYFDRYVVVEAGSRGQACYIYSIDDFNRAILSQETLAAKDGRIPGGNTTFHKPELRLHKQIHKKGWQFEFKNILRGRFGLG